MIHKLCDGCGSTYPDFYFDDQLTCRLCQSQGRMGGGDTVRVQLPKQIQWKSAPTVKINLFDNFDWGLFVVATTHPGPHKFKRGWSATHGANFSA